MRPFEIIIPSLLAVYLLWRHPRPRAIRFLPAAALVATLAHFAVEGYRWQMVPIYVLTSLLVISALIKIRSAADWKPLVSYLTVVLLAILTALPILLPVPSIPTPDGPYRVGTRIYELTDPSRQEIYSGKDEPRRFQIQVWYPAQADLSEPRAPWMTHADVYSRAISQEILHLPLFFLDHLALVKLPAFQSSKVASTNQGYPVILFSHGWNGFGAQNSGQALELASHGYVVVAVQHTYGAVVTVFEDGTIAPNNPSALPQDAPDEEYTIAARKLVHQWSGDLGYALDFMTHENGDASSPFFGRLDLSLVGAYGHSTGGGAAIEFCGSDDRCKAVFGMDPFLRPVSQEVLDRGVNQPAYFMFSQRWAGDVNSLNNGQFKPFFEKSHAALGAAFIEGTSHYDFSDLPLLSPLAAQLGLKGPISGKRVTTIVDDYLLSFFETCLRGVHSDLFDTSIQKYKEVKALH